jgi:methionyl-tRNA formyltransferase
VTEPWRVVIISTALPVVHALGALLRAAGHLPVALVTARPTPTPGPPSEMVTGAPPELDILIPSGRERMAPLIAPLEPDLVLCSGFSWRIPGDALAVPRLGAVNIHPSLLPRYRGPSPLAWAIRDGETEVGLTFHRMDEHFDTGPILAQGSAPLADEDSWEALGPKLQGLAAQLFPRVLERLAAGDPGDAQTEEGASYAGRFDDDYVALDPTRPAEEVLRQVRAWRFAPLTDGGRQGALTDVDGRTVRVLRASLESGEGTRFDCADAAIWLVETEPVEAPAT